MLRSEFDRLPLAVKMAIWKRYYRYVKKTGISLDAYINYLERTVEYEKRTE